MVLLKYMLSRGIDHWHEPVKAEDAAPYFVDYLTAKEYRKKNKEINLSVSFREA